MLEVVPVARRTRSKSSKHPLRPLSSSLTEVNCGGGWCCDDVSSWAQRRTTTMGFSWGQSTQGTPYPRPPAASTVTVCTYWVSVRTSISTSTGNYGRYYYYEHKLHLAESLYPLHPEYAHESHDRSSTLTVVFIPLSNSFSNQPSSQFSERAGARRTQWLMSLYDWFRCGRLLYCRLFEEIRRTNTKPNRFTDHLEIDGKQRDICIY